MSDFISNININPAEKTRNNPQSIFIWIDILGFSDIVEDDAKYFELYDLLSKFQYLFNKSNNYFTSVISDGILLEISNKHHQNLVSVFNQIIDDIGEKQFKFIIENEHFLRGGIAVGTKLKENNLISNGLARSYNLESKSIDWPVIGTDLKNLERLKSLFTPNLNELNLIHSFNNKGSDIFFIDYMKKIDDYEKYTYLLHKKVKYYTEVNISDEKNKYFIRNKYIWLLRHLKQCKGCEIPNNLIRSIL